MIPLYKSLISKNEIKNVNVCLKFSWISSKVIYIKKFEKIFKHNLIKKIINNEVYKLYSKIKNISDENSNLFRSIDEKSIFLDKNKLIKKECITRLIYILKS